MATRLRKAGLNNTCVGMYSITFRGSLFTCHVAHDHAQLRPPEIHLPRSRAPPNGNSRVSQESRNPVIPDMLWDQSDTCAWWAQLCYLLLIYLERGPSEF
jgi:hypothetical protein